MRKPYSIAIRKAPRFKEELIALPEKHVVVLNNFIWPYTTIDDFQEMVACCYEAWNAQKSNQAELAKQLILQGIKKRRKEFYALYSRRNISFNQTIGTSKTQVSDWLNHLGSDE